MVITMMAMGALRHCKPYSRQNAIIMQNFAWLIDERENLVMFIEPG